MLCRLTSLALFSGLLLALNFQNATLAQEAPSKEIAWYDMEHCDICKNMAALKKDMLRIKCETHIIDEGILMIAVVPKDLRETMTKCEKGIAETVQQLEAGKQLALCGFCNTYGSLMGSGAKFTELKTAGGDITMITSTDPEVVKQIQAFGKKSNTEDERMRKELKAAGASAKKSKKKANQ